MSYNQGDIILVPFPFSDLSGSKTRPAIVISNKIVNKTQDVIIAQITTSLRNDSYSFELKESDLSFSLRRTSEVRCHKLATIEKTKIFKPISKLDPIVLTTLLTKIKSFLS